MCGQNPSTWYGMESPQGTLLTTPPGQPIDGCTVPSFSCVAITMAPALWERCRVLAGCEGAAIPGCTARVLPAPVFQSWHQRLQRLRGWLLDGTDCPQQRKRTMAETTDLVTEVGVAAWEMSSKEVIGNDSLRNRARLARRAEGWLRAHYAEPVHVPDLCEALQVSRRELEYAFRDNFELSPRVFLQNLRLNAIHRSLRLAQVHGRMASVTEIALEHGVTHLGRFSAQYRALFGELPWASLRRRKE